MLATETCVCGHDQDAHKLSFHEGALATRPCREGVCECKSFEAGSNDLAR